MSLYEIRGEQRLAEVPEGRVTAFSIHKQEGRIFSGTLKLSEALGETTALDWRASYVGPSIGYTVHNRKTFQEKLHPVPQTSAALRKFIGEHIETYRESTSRKPGSKGGDNGKGKGGNNGPQSKDPDLATLAEVFRGLTSAMRKVAYLFAQGHNRHDIATMGDIAHGTVNTYISQLPDKLSVPQDGLEELLTRLFKHDPSLCADIVVELKGKGDDDKGEGKAELDKSAVVFKRFSPTMRKVAYLFAQGHSRQAIADTGKTPPGTVHSYLSRLRTEFKLVTMEDVRTFLVRLFDHDATLCADVIEELSHPVESPEGKNDSLRKLGLSETEALIATLLFAGLSESQIAAHTNMRLLPVVGAINALRVRFDCTDTPALVHKLQSLMHESEGTPSNNGKTAHPTAHPVPFEAAMSSPSEIAMPPKSTNGVPEAVLLERAITALKTSLPGFKVSHGFIRTGGVTSLSKFKVEEQGTPQSGNGEALLVAIEKFGVALPPGFELEFETDNDGDSTKLTRIEIKRKA